MMVDFNLPPRDYDLDPILETRIPWRIIRPLFKVKIALTKDRRKIASLERRNKYNYQKAQKLTKAQNATNEKLVYLETENGALALQLYRTSNERDELSETLRRQKIADIVSNIIIRRTIQPLGEKALAYEDAAQRLQRLEKRITRQESIIATQGHELRALKTEKRTLVGRLQSLIHKEEDSATFTIDKNGVVISCEGPAITHLGYTPEIFEGNEWYGVLNPQDSTIFREALEKTRQTPIITGFEFGAAHIADASRLTHYKVSVAFEKDEQGNIKLGKVNIARDNHHYISPDKNATTLSLKREIKSNKLTKQRLKKLEEDFRGYTLKARKGQGYVIDLRGIERLGKRMTMRIATLLAVGDNVCAIGINDLNDKYYTSFRDPSLEVPRNRLGLQRITYFTRGKR